MLSPVKHAFRELRKDPGFTAIAIFPLAIGIGATQAMFSFAGALLLRPLPVMKPGGVVAITSVGTSRRLAGVRLHSRSTRAGACAQAFHHQLASDADFQLVPLSFRRTTPDGRSAADSPLLAPFAARFMEGRACSGRSCASSSPVP